MGESVLGLFMKTSQSTCGVQHLIGRKARCSAKVQTLLKHPQHHRTLPLPTAEVKDHYKVIRFAAEIVASRWPPENCERLMYELKHLWLCTLFPVIDILCTRKESKGRVGVN